MCVCACVRGYVCACVCVWSGGLGDKTPTSLTIEIRLQKHEGKVQQLSTQSKLETVLMWSHFLSQLPPQRTAAVPGRRGPAGGGQDRRSVAENLAEIIRETTGSPVMVLVCCPSLRICRRIPTDLKLKSTPRGKGIAVFKRC